MEISLVSGGVNSTMGFHLLCKNSIPVHISYFAGYHLEEHIACSNIYRNKLRSLSVLGANIKTSDYFVPARNLTLASICVSFIPEVSKVNIFGVSDDNCIDKNDDAYHKMSEILSCLSKRNISVASPTQHMTKAQLILESKSKIPSLFNFLKFKIFSCYYPVNMKHCNNCAACLRREIAYFSAGVESKDSLSESIIDLYIQRPDIPDERKYAIKKYANERKGLYI